MRRRGILTISQEMFFELLGLKDACLLAAEVNHFRAGNLEMVIESPDMPILREGAIPQVVTLEEVKCHIQ